MFKNKITLGLHLAVLFLLLAMPLYLISFNSMRDVNFMYRIYAHLVAYIALFYSNYLWLIPHFFFTKKKRQYFIYTILIIVGLLLLVYGLNKYVIPNDFRFENRLQKFLHENNMNAPSQTMHTISFMLNSMLICGFSLGLCSLRRHSQQDKELKELEREKLNSELAFLKNQVSPHFFFNTLNNIYALIEINTHDAQQSVLKLSKMMRYLLYESEQGNTQLSREIDFMTNYVDLMRLRLSPKVDLRISFPSNYPDVNIPPLLFIVFIENAFKHGISYQEKSFIHLDLQCTNLELRFECRNSMGTKANATPIEASGIGLENVRKRLMLLYPQKHQLHINQTATEYSVALVIEMEG